MKFIKKVFSNINRYKFNSLIDAAIVWSIFMLLQIIILGCHGWRLSSYGEEAEFIAIIALMPVIIATVWNSIIIMEALNIIIREELIKLLYGEKE